MSDYLSKPVGVGELLDRVERYGRGRPFDSATTAPMPTDTTPQITVSQDPSDQAMLKRFGGDRALLVALIGLFRDGLPELQAGINTGLATGDAEAVGRAVQNFAAWPPTSTTRPSTTSLNKSSSSPAVPT